jgi:septum site-determining protein MinC
LCTTSLFYREVVMIDVSFQLKGSALTVVVLALVDYNPETLAIELKEKIDQAPHFFVNSPVLISFEKFENANECTALIESAAPLVQICRSLNLQPIGFVAVPEALLSSVKATGFAILPKPNERSIKIPAQESTHYQERVVVEERLVHRLSKVITRPVRSGQQIYAEGADLIVLAQVSEGAEVLADGNIHIYGSLRGRALAGVKGDETARIFCQQLEAELVSIAGNFVLRDALPTELFKKSAQISLSGEKVNVDALMNT